MTPGEAFWGVSTAGSAMNFQNAVFSTSGCVGPILNLRPDSASSRKFASRPRISVFQKLSPKKSL